MTATKGEIEKRIDTEWGPTPVVRASGSRRTCPPLAHTSTLTHSHLPHSRAHAHTCTHSHTPTHTGCTSEANGLLLHSIFDAPSFRVNTVTDIPGVEVRKKSNTCRQPVLAQSACRLLLSLATSVHAAEVCGALSRSLARARARSLTHKNHELPPRSVER